MLPIVRRIALIVCALFFMGAGILHFGHPEPFVKVMPPFIPWPLTMVYISGVAEIAGGIGLLVRPFQRAAAWGLVALLVAVFPANVYMALDQVQVTANPLPVWLLWARVPLQFVLIWWVVEVSRKPTRASAAGRGARPTGPISG
jgi:uncharacterized membrane protein